MPAWFYGPDGEAAVFADMPKGWADHPAKVKPFGNDGDGKPDEPPKRRGRPPKDK